MKTPTRQLTAEETKALQSWANVNGRLWKKLLRAAWADWSRVPQGFEAQWDLLWGLRDLGEGWLASYALPRPA